MECLMDLSPSLFFRTSAGESWFPHLASWGISKMAGLLPSRAFLAGTCFLSPKTLPTICGQSMRMLDFFGYHHKMVFYRFLGQTSDIRTMPVFWLLIVGGAGYGSDFF